MTDSQSLADSPRVVLVGTEHPGNIGSAARAMKTMGRGRLMLVAPERFPDPDAYALSAGANDVLDRAEVHATLADALADCRLVIATTARQRTVPMPELSPREGAQRVIAAQAIDQRHLPTPTTCRPTMRSWRVSSATSARSWTTSI